MKLYERIDWVLWGLTRPFVWRYRTGDWGWDAAWCAIRFGLRGE